MSTRYYPNIIITGTPGCGKTSHAESLISLLLEESIPQGSFTHYAISDVAKERKCIDSYDERLDTSVVDEDLLLDSLEPDMRNGGAIIDWHCCEIFPERFIDLCVVLRTDNSILHGRLSKRGYNDAKLQENIDCEIMDIISQEAKDSYIPEIVIELNSNSVEQMEENVERLVSWITNWIKDHPQGVTNELDPDVVAAHKDDSDEDIEDE